jgi:hypothetical protein
VPANNAIDLVILNSKGLEIKSDGFSDVGTARTSVQGRLRNKDNSQESNTQAMLHKLPASYSGVDMLIS